MPIKRATLVLDEDDLLRIKTWAVRAAQGASDESRADLLRLSTRCQAALERMYPVSV